ncbi:MAG: hypothetical protein IKM47_01140 [Bacteroidaceae bacterium]|nr:hypothetical protein [Bacteroidaceae bacterium]
MLFYTKDRKKIILSHEEFGKGGEGTVYALERRSEYEGSANYVAKIYDCGKVAYDERKLEWLRGILSESKCIAYPRELLYDDKGNCVGFLMPKYTGDTLYMTVFIPKVVKESGWTRLELALLSIRILERFISLHENGILMADVNPNNIVVSKDFVPYLIDVDSYQVGIPEHPLFVPTCTCPVCTREFLSPRLVNSPDLSNCYRTMEDEYYAIAVLLFKIFLVGKNPYARNGVGSLEANMMNMDFVFPEGYDDATNMPRGPWQRIWYNLPSDMRAAFYKAFKKREYTSPKEWIKIIEAYRDGIKDGSYPRVIFPSDNVKTLKKFLELPPRGLDENASDYSGLRNFDNDVWTEGKESDCAFIEFGTNTLRGFEQRGNDLPGRFVIKTSHFECVKHDGEMDLEKLSEKLDSSCESLMHWRKFIKGINPKVKHLHAFGGALLRNLKNRSNVIDVIKEKTGISFGVLSPEEEARALVESGRKYKSKSTNMLIVDVNGVSMFMAHYDAKAESENVKYWEIGNYGSKVLCNRLFAASHVDTMTRTKFEEHDKSIADGLFNICIGHSNMTLVGMGIICELIPNIRKRPLNKTLEELKNEREKLTDLFISSRKHMVADLKNDNDEAMMRKLELRLSLSVYISLMEKFGMASMTILPFGLGESYINYYLNNK